jgi:hypothetical protein
LSSFDVRNRWVLGAVWELPVGKNKLLGINNSFANCFVGGWQLSTNSTIQSGVPQTLTIGINNAGTNNPLPDRPSYSGTGTGYATNRTPSRWYDPGSFVVSPQGTFGNVGRNTMLTPHFQSIDAALAKRFTMPYSEHHSLQIRVEAFNVLNHPTWGCAERKHPGWCGISGRARQRRPSGLRRDQHHRTPHAPDSTGSEVFVLSYARESNTGSSCREGINIGMVSIAALVAGSPFFQHSVELQGVRRLLSYIFRKHLASDANTPMCTLFSMKRTLVTAIFILAATIFVHDSLAFALAGQIGIHDPSTVIFCEGKYYTYGTGGTSLVSDDGWTWSRGAPLPRRGVAPDVIHIGDRYYLYIAANSGPTKADINLLTNKTLDPASPDYRWEEGGVVASSDGVEDCNAIDPGVFLDPNTHRLWLTYGSYFGYIRLVELDPKLASASTQMKSPVTLRSIVKPQS